MATTGNLAPAGTGYAAVLRSPTAAHLLLGTLTGRLPSAMLPVLVLLAEVRGGAGFATAGLLAALQSLAASVGQPLIARRCDRSGHRRTIARSTTATTLVLLALAATPTHAVPLLAVLVLLSGLAPPLQSVQSARWPHLVPETALTSALALDAAGTEILYIGAPLLAAAMVYGPGPAPAYLLAAALGAAGSALVCAHTPAHHTPATTQRPHWLGALRAPALRWLLGIHLGLGWAIGTVPLAGALIADRAQLPATAGWFPAAFAVGSLLGALGYGAHHWPGTALHHLGLGTAAFALSWLPLLACTAPLAANLVAVLPGLMVTPILTSGRRLLTGQSSEANGWLIAALGAGEALGVCVAGHWPALWWPLAGAGAAYAVSVLPRLRLPRGTPTPQSAT